MILIKCDCSSCKYYEPEHCKMFDKATTDDDWCLYWDAPRGEESDGTVWTAVQGKQERNR